MKIHEVLAIEKTHVSAAQKLYAESMEKFKKEQFFKGHVKVLKMIADSPENETIEKAAFENRELPTTVYDTMSYFLDFWARAEDILFTKNESNRSAVADIVFFDTVLVEAVPVDELMGLEVRIEQLRRLMDNAPTLDATKSWTRDEQRGNNVWRSATPEISTKTERRVVPIVLVEATEKHPAQVKELTRDDVVGSWTTDSFSGALTSKQKADSLAVLDELLASVKRARIVANTATATPRNIGKIVADLLLKAIS